MGRNAEMTRNFHVYADFDRFRTGEQVECVLEPDCFVVEGGGNDLKIPYNEIRHVAHVETPQRMAADMVSDVPFFFANSTPSLIATAGVSLGMYGAARAVEPNVFKLMFFVGYNNGGQENWVMLWDTHNYETIPFVQSLASRANTRIIHYYARLMSELQAEGAFSQFGAAERIREVPI